MKLFGQHVHAHILILAAAEYGLAAAAFASVVSLAARSGVDRGNVDSMLVPGAFLFSTAVVVGLTAVGLYQPKQRLRLESVLVRLVAALALAACVIVALDMVFPLGREGWFWTLSFLLSLALLGAARLFFARMVDHGAFRRRVLVYGAGDRAASLLKLRRRSDQRGFKIAAFVPAPGDRARLDDSRVVNPTGSLLSLARANSIDEIVIAMDERRVNFPIKDMLECRFDGIVVTDLLNFLERETGKVKVDLVNPAWLIFSEGFAAKPGRRIASRVLDLAVAISLAIVALPVFVVVTLGILLEDGLPLFYRQQRVGLGGKPFTLYKFRSMIRNAESDGRPQWTDRGDPRITKVGRVIRKLRFDELPQLINVIRGDMSIVGPRPERPEFVDQLSVNIPYYHERHTVKPGITGWAQLCYPYGSSENDALEKLQYDLYYVKHRSLIFDLVVILQTVEVVLWGKGAR